jgi:hypothetical protein
MCPECWCDSEFDVTSSEVKESWGLLGQHPYNAGKRRQMRRVFNTTQWQLLCQQQP